MMTRRAFVGGLLATAGACALPRGRRGTAVVVHGLGTTAARFAVESPYLELTERLRFQGWDVNVVPYRFEGVGSAHAEHLCREFDRDPTGQTVLDAWLEDYDQATRRANGPVLVVGISWGGMLALHAKADRFVCHLPATEPARLTEFEAYDLSALSTFPQPSGPGLLTWATDDQRVGWKRTAELADEWGCDRIVYDHLGHSTTLGVVGDLATATRP